MSADSHAMLWEIAKRGVWDVYAGAPDEKSFFRQVYIRHQEAKGATTETLNQNNEKQIKTNPPLS